MSNLDIFSTMQSVMAPSLKPKLAARYTCVHVNVGFIGKLPTFEEINTAWETRINALIRLNSSIVQRTATATADVTHGSAQGPSRTTHVM